MLLRMKSPSRWKVTFNIALYIGCGLMRNLSGIIMRFFSLLQRIPDPSAKPTLHPLHLSLSRL